MYSKIVRKILQILHGILMVFIKMVSNSADSDQIQPYAFRAFKFESVPPSKKSKVPFPRSGHRIGADSANVYCFGGYNPVIPEADHDFNEDDNDGRVNSYPLFQELWRFNFTSKEWFRYPNMESLPFELVSNALLLHRNILMVYVCVYGGTGSPFGFRCSNQLYFCPVNDNRGIMNEISTTGQHPLQLYGQALVYYNDYLYTIGGTTGLSYTCDIHRLNLKTRVWEAVYISKGQQDYEPVGRYRHEVAFDNRNIYVLGGGTVEDAYEFDNIPTFSLEKQCWQKRKTLPDNVRGFPKPRLCHGAVQINTDNGIQVYIAGGHDGQNVFDDLWRLDLNSMSWTHFVQCKLPQPMYFHAVAITPEGRMCVFGGIYRTNDDDTTRSNNLYSTWLCVPKLSEMCWEAIVHYSPHISNFSKDKLIDLGFPRRFVQRLEEHKL